jgi:aldehyde dehydrogenase (NAD(P)+)
MTEEDGHSGIGVVHNSLLFDKPEKTIVRGSFYRFPNSWLHGDPCLMPRPPWFLMNKTMAATAPRIAKAAFEPGYRHLPGILFYALRG